MDNLAERIANLSPEKRALLELRLKMKGAVASGQTIPRRANDGPAPLSFAQQRLWFLNQLEPESPFYNIPNAIRLNGPLNVEVLRKSLDAIVVRHEVLRTTFGAIDGVPVQVGAQSRPAELEVIDLSAGQDGEGEIQRLIKERVQRPFNLSSDLMLRATLLKLRPDEHILLLVIHHIASDGWSAGILWQELAALYGAFSTNRPSLLPDLPIQYADFAAWQRQWIQGEVLETQLSYWKKQLSGVPVLELPTDRPRPPVQTYCGAHHSLILGKSLSEALKALSRVEGTTLFMTLLAAFKTLLYRYTGQQDIAVGSPIANRNRAEIEGLIGFFVNSLVMRTDLSGDPSFRELLGRVREVTLGAYAHQDLPFEKLVEELQPERDLSRNPIFQVMFALQNAPRSELELHGLAVERFGVETRTTRFDLEVHCWETPGGLQTRFVYNADLFDAATVNRMLAHFQNLLEGIVVNPEQRLSDLPILTDAERQQLLVEWNDTKRDYPKDKCIHELFEAQVERTPDAVAVVFEDEQLTYRELNRKANQLAHHLRKLGVGPDRIVAVRMDRSLEMLIGLLSVLKAGGAYLALDAAYPKERLRFMLQDSRVSVLLTQRFLLENLPKTDAHVVCLDTEWKNIAQESVENPQSEGTADNLAYVIYTSGSTGTPKGVEVLHRGISRLLVGVEYVRLEANHAFLHVAPTSFDASTFEIWGALLHGAKCVLFPGTLVSPGELRELINKHGISTLWLTTSLFNAVIDQAPQTLSGVRQLLIGGEALSVPHVRKALSLLPGTDIINAYGPTESTTFACCYSIPRQLDASITSIPIGRPIANTGVYLLDASLSPVPIGVSGDLYIGGDGLARGYLNRPELTAEKFIPNPFSDEPGARLYKTGDLARYRPDGNIEFIGRMDDQVKIRGFRIEPGEVEALLRQHQGVWEAVILARDEVENPKSEIQNPKSGDKRLVAYVVPSQEPVPTASDLRSLLKSKLPDYMIPSAFVFLDALPLTPNGKVDRRALPAPDQTRPELSVTFVAPRTPVEEVLAGIWADVLKLERVGIHDNFFELGGHSLLATRIISRVRSTFQVELPLRSIFEVPTIAGLAEGVYAALRIEPSLRTPPLRPGSRDRDLPLSFAQQRLWFFDELEPANSVYNIPAVFRLAGPLNVAVLEQSFNEIVRRHESLRISFAAVEGQPVQVVAPALTLSLPIVDLRDLSQFEREVEARRLATEEAQRPFELAHGPLLRVTLLRLGDEEHVLLLTIHHIISDGWSMGVFFRELSALYEAFSAGKPSPLPELPVQYADFAVWQREWLRGEVLESQLGYWKEQLKDTPRVLELHTDWPRPAVQSYRGARQSVVLPKTLSQTLKDLSRQEGVTLFMTLLAAFKVLLYRYTGQEDIVVGTPIAGRNRPEIEALIGFFVNTLVLRTDLSGNPTFRELLGRVREVCLGAYAHQNLPFEKLVEELQPERDLSHTPLFQVFFNMINLGEDTGVKLARLKVEAFGSHEPASKFDLTMYVDDRGATPRFSLVYNADLFEAATINRMLGSYESLLDGIVGNPEQRLSDLPILTDAERQQLLVAWNDTRRAYPNDLCIHQLFEAQVERTPAAVAVVFEDQQLTYCQLNARANQLAHHLKKHGAGPETLVGICAERSLGMIVGVMAILKSGSAYVPLDPEYPEVRVDHILAETQIDFLLTKERLLNRFPEFKGRALCLDRDSGLFEREQEENPDTILEPGNLAYITYTSGSTGKPKGVLTCHRGVVNYLSYLHETYNLNCNDTVLQLPSLSFDASVRDLVGPLTAGAKVVMVNDFDAKEPVALLSEIKERGVTCILSIVPTLLNGLLEASRSRDLVNNSIRLILVSGEALPMTMCQKAKEVFGQGALLVNQYGPTECTMTSSYHPVLEVDGNRDIAPLGMSIPNAQMYIVDSHLNLVPIGIPGEVYIGGVGLARGYLNCPDLTAEKFIPNPFSNEPGARLYKTGDLGRYLPDGTIEFLGRIDRQVKIHGFRVELGEIEAVLGQHPAVRDTVVLAREETPVDKRLAAYIVPSQAEAPAASGLREFLKERLPDYMMPTAFMFLDALPLTPNGKVDRRALPAPDQSRPDLESVFVAPRTPAEKAMAEIWAQVLELERVGIHDNFFELGGHSLLATQAISRVREAFHVELPLRSLFENPTVASLAVQIAQIQAKKDAPEEM